jgi:hypothetical protein
LNKIDGVAKIETNPGARTCSFMVPQDVDVSAKLVEVSEGNSHLGGYTITSDGSTPSDSDTPKEAVETNPSDSP